MNNTFFRYSTNFSAACYIAWRFLLPNKISYTTKSSKLEIKNNLGDNEVNFGVRVFNYLVLKIHRKDGKEDNIDAPIFI